MDNVRSLDEAREKVAETVEKTRDTVKEQFEHAREKVDEGLHQASEEVHRAAEKARQTAQEQAEIRSRQLREGYETARHRGEEWAGEANDYVMDNPGKSLLLAGAAGFILGLLLRPRS